MNESPWPLFGYAPGMYTFVCRECGNSYLKDGSGGLGDKRSTQCLSCAVLQAKSRIATLEAENQDLRSGAYLVSVIEQREAARKALTVDFCVLYLDGRNEHGTHVIPSYPRSFEPVDDDISEQAEAIFVAAENEGFQTGDHVWTEFYWVSPQIGDEGRVELSGYWEFDKINVAMTRAALSAMETRND